MSRDAVLVAVNECADKRILPLRYAQADALAVAEALRARCGFDVRIVVGEDATRRNLLRAMQSLDGGNTLLVYFALHGQMQHGCYLLHTYDSDIEGKNALTFGEVVRQCAVKCGYKEVAFVLDACRKTNSDTSACPSPSIGQLDPATVAGNVRDIAAQIKTHVQNVTRQTTQTAVHPEEVAWIEVLYGCSDGQYCYEDDTLQHGLFSYGLVSALADSRSRPLTLRNWGDRAARLIKQWSQEEPNRVCQQPMHYSQTGRDGIIIHSDRVSAAGRHLSGEEGFTGRVNDDTARMSEYLARIDNGRLVLLHSIGQGGMGRVWLAKDGRLNRLVAVKCPSDEVIDSRHGSQRFLQEARAAAQLRHSSTVNIYNVHQIVLNGSRSLPLIEMEYIEGSTLQEAVERRGQGLEPDEVIDLAERLCEALEEAHSHNIIHRDIKPANIILSVNGVPKLVDFGIALAARGPGATRHSRYTMTGQGLGSLNYSAPEQLRGLQADARSDIYALGATLYYAFSGRELSGVLSRKDIPATLVPVIEKACQHVPDDRFQSMTEFRQALLSVGGQSLGGTYVKSQALCPHCGRENPENYKYCRHCGGSLAELFRPCPKCEQEIRNDIAFCAHCGCNVALECLRNDIAAARGQHDYEKLRDLAEAGAKQFPGQKEFKKQRTLAERNIKKSNDLIAKLESVENDSQRIELLRALVALYPNHEKYQSQHAKLIKDREVLQKEVQHCSERHDYGAVLQATEEGLRRFPEDRFFSDQRDLVRAKLDESARLEKALQEATNDGERLEFLQALLVLYPDHAKYNPEHASLLTTRETLKNEVQDFSRRHDYESMLQVTEEGLRRFPQDTLFIEHHDMAQARLDETARLHAVLREARNDDQRIEVLRTLLTLYPDHKTYCSDRKKLLDDREELRRRIDECRQRGDFRSVLRIAKEGVKRFPQYLFFTEQLHRAKKELRVSSRIRQHLGLVLLGVLITLIATPHIVTSTYRMFRRNSLYGAGTEALRSENWARADDLFSQMQEYGVTPRRYRIIGDVYYENEQYQLAYKYYKQGSASTLLLAITALFAEDLQKAGSHAWSALHSDDLQLAAHQEGLLVYILGRRCEEEGDLPHALDYYSRSLPLLEGAKTRDEYIEAEVRKRRHRIETLSEDAEEQYRSGWDLLRKKQSEDAEALFDRAYNSSGDSVLKSRARFAQAYSKQLAGDFVGAKDIYQEILPRLTLDKMEEDFIAGIYSTIARGYWAEDHCRSGIEYAFKAYRHDPNGSSIRNQLAWYLISSKDRSLRIQQAALKIAEETVLRDHEKSQTSPDSLGTLAGCYASISDFEKAVFYCEQAVELADAEYSGSDDLEEALCCYHEGQVPWEQADNDRDELSFVRFDTGLPDSGVYKYVRVGINDFIYLGEANETIRLAPNETHILQIRAPKRIWHDERLRIDKANYDYGTKTVRLEGRPHGGDTMALTWSILSNRVIKNIYRNGDVTFTDIEHGRMWVYDPTVYGVKNWNDATDFCEALDYGGYSDWVLPSEVDLKSLVAERNILPPYNYKDPMDRSKIRCYWTAGAPPSKRYAIVVTAFLKNSYRYPKKDSYGIWPTRELN